MGQAVNKLFTEQEKLDKNVFYVEPKTLEKAMNGELKGISGCEIPSWDFLKGLTISKLNKIKDNLRTMDEIDDLYNQCFFGYCYCVKKCLDEKVNPPIKSFTNYYSHFLQTEPLRYIKKACLGVKIPYQGVGKFSIGDEESNSGNLAKYEFENATTEDEEDLYLKDIIERCFKVLDDEEKRFVELKFGFKCQPHSTLEISHIMKIKRGRLIKLEATIMFKLKNYMIQNGVKKDILNK